MLLELWSIKQSLDHTTVLTNVYYAKLKPNNTVLGELSVGQNYCPRRQNSKENPKQFGRTMNIEIKEPITLATASRDTLYEIKIVQFNGIIGILNTYRLKERYTERKTKRGKASYRKREGARRERDCVYFFSSRRDRITIF